MSSILTKGALTEMISTDSDIKPILQVKNFKCIKVHNEDRCRLNLYDGEREHNYAMFVGVPTNMSVGCLIKVNKFFKRRNEANMTCLIITEYKVIEENSEQSLDIFPEELPPPIPVGGIRFDSVKSFPIETLNPFQKNNWTIKGTVTQKKSVQEYKKSNTEGKFFNFVIADDGCDIRVTAFNADVDRFFDLIHVGSQYSISRGQVKQANPTYRTTKSAYEIYVRDDTEILQLYGGSNLAVQMYNFVNINEVLQKPEMTIVDVVAVAHRVGPVTTITARHQSKELEKRDLTLIDRSGQAIRLTLWGEQTKIVEENSNPVIVVKSAIVKSYQEIKSLSANQNSVVLINPPEIPEVSVLAGWYATEKRYVTCSASSSTSSSKHTELSQILVLSSNVNGEYFYINGMVCDFRQSSIVYKACPKEGCNKKLLDAGNGLFRCEKCGENKESFRYNLLVKMQLIDFTGSLWVTAFQNVGEQVLRHKAEDIGDMMQNQRSEFRIMFDEAKFNSLMFKIKTKADNFNDENRLNVTVVEVKPLNLSENIDRMIEYLENR